MSNIPLGAEGDPLAPYNFDEKVFKFSVEVKGDFYYGTYLLFLSIHEYLSFICLIKAVQDLHDRAFSRPVFP